MTIVYDIDDTLNNLNKHISSIHKTPLPNRYNIRKATNLTDKQKEIIIGCYGNADIFKDVEWNEGYKETEELANKHKIIINSLCLTDDIAEIKYRRIRKDMPWIEEKHIILTVGFEKPKVSADIIVEDCIENVADYNGDTHKIIIDMPWNKYGVVDIRRVRSLIEANNEIKSIIKSRS